jgi:hypothetical protein
MNYVQTILFYLVLATSGISLFAVNKQQIRLSNQSHDKTNANRNMLVHITWQHKKLPGIIKETDLILRSDRKNFLVKSPDSQYKLLSIDITPAINLSALATGAISRNIIVTGIIAAIAYKVTHSLNYDTKRAHGCQYFVLTTEKKNSAIQSQKKVKIIGYKTLAEYNLAIGNAPVEIIETDTTSSTEKSIETDNNKIKA